MKTQVGIGIFELLIGLLLSSMMMILMMNHYLNTKKNYQKMQNQLEENLDLFFIVDLIRETIRKAGFTPCGEIDQLITLNASENNNPLTGIINQPNFIQFNRMSEHFNRVDKVMNSITIFSAHDALFQKSQTVLIADCYHAEVKIISHVRSAGKVQIINLSTTLNYHYQNPIYIGEWINESYYVQSRAHQTTSLYYQLKHVEELSTNVHRLIGEIDNIQGRKLVRVILGLDRNKALEFKTWVRSH